MAQQPVAPWSISLVADLGSTPALGEVARYLQAVDRIWFFSMQMALLAANSEAGAEARRALRVARSQAGAAADLDDPLIGPRSPLGRYRSFLADYIPTPGIYRLQIASPLEVVLTGVASEIKPIGYAMGGMLIIERVFKLVMQWQRHRYDLRAPEPETLREDLIGTEIAHGLSSQGGLVIPFRVDEVQAASSISRVAHYQVIEVHVHGSPRETEPDEPSTRV